MDRHHPPRALHHELNEKSAQNQQGRARRKNPKRNEQHSANRWPNDGAAAAPLLRKMSNQSPATNHPDRINDCDLRCLVRIETALLLQIGCVKILRAMRHVVERSHEQRGINEYSAVLSDKD